MFKKLSTSTKFKLIVLLFGVVLTSVACEGEVNGNVPAGTNCLTGQSNAGISAEVKIRF